MCVCDHLLDSVLLWHAISEAADGVGGSRHLFNFYVFVGTRLKGLLKQFGQSIHNKCAQVSVYIVNDVCERTYYAFIHGSLGGVETVEVWL